MPVELLAPQVAGLEYERACEKSEILGASVMEIAKVAIYCSK